MFKYTYIDLMDILMTNLIVKKKTQCVGEKIITSILSFEFFK